MLRRARFCLALCLLWALVAMQCAHELPPPCDAATAAGMIAENRLARAMCNADAGVGSPCPRVDEINREADARRAYCLKLAEDASK